MSFTLTENPQFYGLDIFKQYFDDLLVSAKQQDGNFSKTEKKIISQQTCKGPYIYDVLMEGG